jgi:TonB family protein
MERGNPFGIGFAWYAEALQRRLSEEWGKTLGQVSGPTDKPVVVRFQILRDGRIEDIRVVDSSGNRSFDYSAHRAVQFINPFRALPPALRRNAIAIEMTFRMN